jgi:hypothetical protein
VWRRLATGWDAVFWVEQGQPNFMRHTVVYKSRK